MNLGEILFIINDIKCMVMTEEILSLFGQDINFCSGHFIV